MKSMFLLLGSGLLMTTLAVAQDATGADPSSNSQSSKTYQTSGNVIRGCLSGSAGNYTVTDQNGMQYSIAGPDNQLAARVGHEIEITTRQDQSSESNSQGDQATAKSTNSVQVSDVRDISSTCKTVGSTGAPMNDDRTSPKGSTSTSEPPQMMAMLQEQKPGTTTQQQATPPVTSQTPATSASPTATGQQAGTSPANPSSTAAGSDANNQGVNSPSMTDPNAAPSSATPSNAQQPPQANGDDANKPLYERQATDIPWANHSGNNGTANPPH